jgi:REP element-mobilizing transposase RayT
MPRQTRAKISRSVPGQLELAIPSTHGGRRPGAGRPNRSGLRSHIKRRPLNPREPLHVTLKLRPGLPSLRKKEIFRCLREAVRIARKKGFGVAHFAILSNHLHFVMEPPADGVHLGTQIQSLCISFAKRLNARTGNSGSVFLERYHVRPLRTPTEVRNALAYVLTNEARHSARSQSRTKSHDAKVDSKPAPRSESEPKRASPYEIRLDPFSSALAFQNWRELLGRRASFLPTLWPDHLIEGWHAEILSPPRTWLLQRGWKRTPT